MIERMGSVIDMIVGCPPQSVTRREFFLFQRDLDTLNQEFGFRFSGALWLMAAAGKHDGDLPFEIYFAGVKRHGDSIGRPSRHQRKKMTTPDSESQPGSRKVGLITDLATRMKCVATTWEGALKHSGEMKKLQARRREAEGKSSPGTKSDDERWQGPTK